MILLTPPGMAGIAVVRAVGVERGVLAALLWSTAGRPIALRAGAPPRRASLQIDGAVIDDVLVVDRGARGLEVHLHGAPAVLESLRGKIDLATGPEASGAEFLLRNAMCREQLDLAVEQWNFDLEEACRELERLCPAERRVPVAELRRRSVVAMAHVQPQRLVLVGAQNAGKSSLFNRLLFRERALTGPEPGLTRDPVAECTTLDGYPYDIVDTAGEGDVASAVDAEAVQTGRRQRRGALLVLVVDAARGPSDNDLGLASDAAIVVANKSDLSPAPWPAELACHLHVSCSTQDGGLVRRRLGACLRRFRSLPTAGPVGGVAALTEAGMARVEELATGVNSGSGTSARRVGPGDCGGARGPA